MARLRLLTHSPETGTAADGRLSEGWTGWYLRVSLAWVVAPSPCNLGTQFSHLSYGDEDNRSDLGRLLSGCHETLHDKCKLLILSRGAELKATSDATQAWPREEQGFSLGSTASLSM